MRVHVAFTPDEAAAAATGVVIDVIRAFTTAAHLFDRGAAEIWPVADVDEAKRVFEALAEGGEVTRSPEWQRQWRAMVEFAAGRGWTDGAGRVRAHVEPDPAG